MAVIKLDPQEIEASATLFKTQKEAVAQVMQQLDGEVGKLEGQWEGLAETNFQAEWVEHKKALEELGVQLEQVSAALSAYAKAMEQAEQQGAAGFKQ